MVATIGIPSSSSSSIPIHTIKFDIALLRFLDALHLQLEAEASGVTLIVLGKDCPVIFVRVSWTGLGSVVKIGRRIEFIFVAVANPGSTLGGFTAFKGTINIWIRISGFMTRITGVGEVGPQAGYILSGDVEARHSAIIILLALHTVIVFKSESLGEVSAKAFIAMPRLVNSSKLHEIQPWREKQRKSRRRVNDWV
jgi:hypothetical protein